MIKAILIEKEIIWEVEVDEKNFLQSCYKLIGCDLIEVAVDLGNDTIYVDEEGFCKEPEFLFHVIGYPQPFAGRGLVVGYNAHADKHIDTHLSVQNVRDIVRYV